jgi:hypothetical protein
MTSEEQIQNLIKRVDELEKKSIQVQMKLTEKENLKSAIFDNIFQSDQTVPAVSATAPYLKVIWKNKVIYIPFSK